MKTNSSEHPGQFVQKKMITSSSVLLILFLFKVISCSQHLVFDLTSLNLPKYFENCPRINESKDKEFKLGSKRKGIELAEIDPSKKTKKPRNQNPVSDNPDSYSNFTPIQIINHEMKTCRCTFPEKRQVFLKALEFIAANDLVNFVNNEHHLLTTFGVIIVSELQMHGLKDYLARFMVLFGADKFFGNYGNSQHSLINMDILKYLVDTKPLDVVLNTLLGFRQIRHLIHTNTEIITILEEKYSGMDYFRKFAIRLIQAKTPIHWSLNVFAAQSELEAFKVFGKEILRNGSSKGLAYLSNLPIELSHLYLQCSMEEKFDFVKLIIDLDDVQKLEEIILIDPNMINFLFKGYYYYYLAGKVFNLMECCVQSNALKCFAFLLEIVPEMIDNPTKLPCTLGFVILNSNNTEFLNILIEAGYGSEATVKDSESTQFSMVQYAFKNRRLVFLKHFITKFGLERVRADISVIWPTKQSIILHVLSQELCGDFINFMFKFLDINLTDRFDYNGKHGDLTVFLNIKNEHYRSKLLSQGSTSFL